MSAKSLTGARNLLPSVFNDFFKPWDEWLDTNGFLPSSLTVPAVNITEDSNGYQMSLAIPGRKKEDFNIDVSGDMLTISSETSEEKEEKEKRYTRREYSYNSFTRSFTLPEEVAKDKIEAGYTDGILNILLPKAAPTAKDPSQKVPVK